MTRAAPQRQGAPLAGRFVIEREVGRGGVGIVYRAEDRQTGQHVALKVIATQGVDASEEARFAREGRLLADLDHPHIVKLVAWGTIEDGAPFVAMEWLEGEDLAARSRRAPLTLRQGLEVGLQIAVALGAAHDAGIVHRDIKPSNIFLLGPKETAAEAPIFAKLVDFGVATEEDVQLTKTGAVVGTPAYMAPEQARGDASIDARADIYSLGATLFELVAGRPPHMGPTAIATLARLVTTEAPRLADLVPDVPASLDELVTRMLSTNPDDRPGCAAELARSLETVLTDAASHKAGRPSSHARPSEAEASQGTRLVTSIVALRLGTSEARARAVEDLRARGADAVPLGHDAVVAHLGARRALGDEATRALDLGRALASLGARVGIATGRTKVDLTRPVGEVVDRAAALAHAAEIAHVLSDATTTELARGRFELQLRGDGSAVVGDNLGAKRTEVSGGAPFIGREAELAQAMGAFERCVDDGCPILVTITGPPGIGKSRLGREVLAHISARPQAPRVVVVRCEPFGRSHALGVAAHLLRTLLGIANDASLVTAALAIEDHLADDGDRSAGPVSVAARKQPVATGRELLACLVANEPLPEGMDARGARDELWLAMTELVGRITGKEPVVVVLDDMQWADPESLGWIDHALGRSLGRSLYVLGMLRPNFWREQGHRFAGRDHVKIELRPISRRAARAIARAMLGETTSEMTLERIAAQAAGSPLFAEELARLTALGRDADVAPTIEAAIQVSLDALDDAGREATRRLSVFGLSAWDTGLEALGIDSPGGVLRQLSASELLLEQAQSRFRGTREWAFKHALVRDVAYASLGAEEKARLHALAARWLAKMGEDAATVAHHFELGGQATEAAIHWERAARRALAANALEDAVRMADAALAFAEGKKMAFTRALLLDEAYSRLDPRASDRETAVRALDEAVFDEASGVRARGARARYDDARGAGEHVAERLDELCSRAAALGLVDEEARCAAALAARYAFAGDFPAAERAAAHLLELAERRGVPAAAVDAWQTLAVVRQSRGELASALDARRNAARAASSAGLKEREAMLTVNVGFALTTIGARQEARQAIESGLALAQAIGSAGTVRHGKMILLGWAATFGADPTLDAQLAEPRSDADAAATGVWMSPDRSTLGTLFYRACELMLADGNASASGRALSLLKIATDSYRATGNRDVLPVALGTWAEAERRCGAVERARDIAREAADLIEHGAPSLLNEAIVFLALHDACVDLGDLLGARDAIARAMPPLARRAFGLAGTAYARAFLTQLPHNAGLLAAAEAYGLVPPEIERLLERGAW